jgi:hypothetical protein
MRNDSFYYDLQVVFGVFMTILCMFVGMAFMQYEFVGITS